MQDRIEQTIEQTEEQAGDQTGNGRVYGNGRRPENGAAAISAAPMTPPIHGGSTDGLPVAATHAGNLANSRAGGGDDGQVGGAVDGQANGQANGHANGDGAADTAVSSDASGDADSDGDRPAERQHERNGISNGSGTGNGAVSTDSLPSNGNGAGWTEAKLPYDPQPEMELAMPDGGTVALTSVLESLLFVASEAVEVSHLAKSLNLRPAEVEAGLALLAEQYKARGDGLRVQVHKERYQLVTSPVAAAFVEDFLNVDVSTKLSSAALETLAIVAYRQPVTRVQIEAIRGVDCSNVLRSLVVRGLIEEVGRLDAVGRPIVYGVTELFMQHFGLTELGDLPALGSEDADMLAAATALAEEADVIVEQEIAEEGQPDPAKDP